MRTIKFRAWDTTAKAMILDYKIGFLEGTYSYSINDEFTNEEYVFMQYTGLKDQNGKEIYEGDIIEIDWNDKRYPKHISKNPVAWNENDACWDLPEGGSPKSDANGHYKVIGNIHENPELLKK